MMSIHAPEYPGFKAGDQESNIANYLAHNLGGNPFPAIVDMFRSGGDGRDTSGDVAFKTGELLRAQFEDWKKTFMPVELEQLQQISMNNPSVLKRALESTGETVENTYSKMAGVLDRQNQSLGISPTTMQSNTTKRLLNLDKAATMATANNQTRAATRQMDEMLIMGTTPNPNIAKARPGVTG